MAHWQIPMVVEFLQLQYIDRVIDVCCAAPAVRVQTWRIRSSSHSCNIDAGHRCSHACRFALTSVLGWSRQCSTLWWLRSWHSSTWLVFLGPCTQVRGQGSPAIRAGKGWRGRRELAPRCSATQLGASRAWALEKHTHCATIVACTTHHHTRHTHHRRFFFLVRVFFFKMFFFLIFIFSF